MRQAEDGGGEGGREGAEAEPPADVLLVGCVKGKLEWASKVAAKDLYVSPLWRCRRLYAERFNGPWFILSAKHGLLHPESRIMWYDRSLAHLTARQRRAWSDRVIESITAKYPAIDGKIIEIHAGKDYVDFGLESGLQEVGAVVRRPLLGIPIGMHLGWYRKRGIFDD